MGELDRAAESQGISPDALLRAPRTFHTLQVTDMPILDLRKSSSLERVGLLMDDIRDDDWSACQLIGHAAWFLEFAGVLAPSALGSGYVLTAFEDRIGPGALRILTSEPLDVSLYRRLSASIGIQD